MDGSGGPAQQAQEDHSYAVCYRSKLGQTRTGVWIRCSLSDQLPRDQAVSTAPGFSRTRLPQAATSGSTEHWLKVQAVTKALRSCRQRAHPAESLPTSQTKRRAYRPPPLCAHGIGPLAPMSASDHPTQVKNMLLFLSLQNRRRPRGRFTFMAKWSKRLLNMAAALTVAAFMLSGRS